MTQVSYSDLFDLPQAVVLEDTLVPGDLVRTGGNLFPHYVVVAVSDHRAWLRNVQNGEDALTDLARCRRINGPLSHDH